MVDSIQPERILVGASGTIMVGEIVCGNIYCVSC